MTLVDAPPTTALSAAVLPTGVRRAPGSLTRGRGTLLALCVFLVFAGSVFAVPGTARLAGSLYLLTTIATGWLLARRDPAEFVEFSLWLWVLSPCLRRMVDWRMGFDPNSVVLLAPLLVSMVALLVIHHYRLQGDRRVVRLMLRGTVLVVYASVVALILLRGPMAAGLGFLQLVAPAALALLALTAVDQQVLFALVTRFVTGTLLVVGGYGIIQFLVAPAWDAQWLIDVEDVATSFGRPEPLQIRVFSTLNDPGSLSVVLVFCLLWVLAMRRISPIGALALVIGGSCLALTLVRSAWIAVVIGIVLAVIRGWIKPERLLVVVVGLIFAGSIFTTAVQPVLDRFDESRSAGATDNSLQSRLTFQSKQFVPALLNVVGEGLGSTGTAARRDGDTDQQFADTDSGYLENLRLFGGPLGLALIVATFTACWTVFRRAEPLSRGAACFAMTVPVQLFFSNTFTNVTGLMLWLALAAAARPGHQQHQQHQQDRQHQRDRWNWR